MNRPGPQLRLVTHNVYVGQPAAQLRDNLAELVEATDRPHALALQEAIRLDRGIPGYRRVAVQLELHRDDGGCVLLVRNDVQLVKPRIVQVAGPWWTGPKHGLRHPPKVFVGATLETEGRRWDVLDVHRCWTGRGRRNMDTWRAEHAALVRWLRRRGSVDRGRRPVVALGDWNAGAHELDELAQDTGRTCQLAMRGIDGALAINATAAAHELGRRFGSDGHQPVAVTVRPVR